MIIFIFYKFFNMLPLEYNSIFFFCCCSFILCTLLTLLNKVSSRYNKESEKLFAFECGFEPIGNTKDLFSVHFYIVGILFLIFDLEIIFLYPWVIKSQDSGFFGYCSILFFLIFLFLAFFFEWSEGVLSWSKRFITSL